MLKMLQVDFYQTDCCNIKATEKVHDSLMLIFNVKEINNNLEEVCCSILGPSAQEVFYCIKDALVDSKILFKTKNKIDIIYTIKPTELWRSIAKSNFNLVFPFGVCKGLETWTFLTVDDPKVSLKYLKYLVDHNSSTEIAKIRKFDIDIYEVLADSTKLEKLYKIYKLANSLGEGQLELLKKAVIAGFYDNPRRISAKELARDENVSTTTVVKKLRNIQGKIMKNFIELLQ